jgi:hypothetical protein
MEQTMSDTVLVALISTLGTIVLAILNRPNKR